MKDFVSLFIDYTRQYESPTNFWKWSAYATVAAVLRDNVHYYHGMNRKTYPNIYVVMLADSAEYRKSGPFTPVVSLLNNLNVTKVIKGRASVQAILDRLGQMVGPKGTSAGLKGGSCILIAEELASFFVSDPALIPLITDMYDYRDNWDYNIKSGGTEIKNLCVTMLAASNETFLREVYTNTAVYGGLLGRTIMIKPDETRPPNSLLDVTEDTEAIKDLLNSLKQVALLKGTTTMTPDAKVTYDIWYHALYNSYKKCNDRTGVTQRMHTTALKLAIIIAGSHYTREINNHYIEEAIEEITKLKSNYEVYAMSAGKSTQSEIGALFLNTLWNSPDKKVTRDKILMFHWNMMSAKELDDLTETLLAAKLIKAEPTGGNTIIYEMTEKCKDIFLKKELNSNNNSGGLVQ